MALAMGAFVIAMMEHDRVTAFETFEQAIAVSPSAPLTYFLGTSKNGAGPAAANLTG